MDSFLTQNRTELIARCRAKVDLRAIPGNPERELDHGITVFLDQLIKTLQAERSGHPERSRKLSGPSGGGNPTQSEMGEAAAAHGRELLLHGYTVEEVVHDYGDLCQAITDLAFEKGVPIKVDEFRTLNRCLDNPIANAVTEFGYQHDSILADTHADALNLRLGYLAHELRNQLSTAVLALSVIRAGNVGLAGATGEVLDRSLVGLRVLIDRSLAEVRISSGLQVRHELFSLADFIAAAKLTADLEAQVHGSLLVVAKVDPKLAVDADRDLLFSAVGNLLQNAFKFSYPGSEVTLNAYAAADRIVIDIEDHCGGLEPGAAETMFDPYVQQNKDQSGMGLGLSIARRSAEANSGVLRVRDIPGTGCVFSIDLPRQALPDPVDELLASIVEA